MRNQIITTLLVVFLLAPQTELEANGRHHYYHDSKYKFKKFIKKHKIKKFKRATKAEQALLEQAISDINTKLQQLEQQVGGVPSELADKLAALQVIVNNNSSDVSLALSDIVSILSDVEMIISDTSDHAKQIDVLESTVASLAMSLSALESAIDGLELRIVTLEQQPQPDPSTSDVVFAGEFIQGEEADAGLKQAWTEFRSNAIGQFASIEIKNSLNGSVVCSDSIVATNIANELNAYTGTETEIATFNCGTQVWNIGIAVSEVELNVGGPSGKVIQCNEGASVRPGVGVNWGGVGTIFGGSGNTCGAPTQTLEVILTR